MTGPSVLEYGNSSLVVTVVGSIDCELEHIPFPGGNPSCLPPRASDTLDKNQFQ